MSRTIKFAVLGALPVAALSICALAQTAAPAVAPVARPSFFAHMLQKMDTNGDGRISQEEFLAAATARFKSMDAQNKGSIDAADIASSPETVKRDQHAAQFMVKRMDTAGNGYVTQEEFLAAAEKRFTRMDKAGNGKLTPEELTAPRWSHGNHAAVSAVTAKAANAATATASASTASTGPHNRAQFAQAYFAKIDTNHDGVVTKDEYLAAATLQFKTLDTQGSGRVTAEELAASPQALKRDERQAQHQIKRLDTNGDGVVSMDEYLAAAKTRFNKLDKNGDGFIEADELPAHRWTHSAKPSPSDG
jgi:Ca2+-binding EF-hand superfamily protein